MAKEFNLVSSVNPVVYKTMRIASQAYAIGDAVMLDRAADATEVVPATASSITANIFGIAMEAKTASDTTLLVALLDSTQIWAADATNTPSTNDNEQRMILTDKGTVNNTHTDVAGTTGIFQQLGVGQGTNRIVGRFLTGYAAT